MIAVASFAVGFGIAVALELAAYRWWTHRSIARAASRYWEENP